MRNKILSTLTRLIKKYNDHYFFRQVILACLAWLAITIVILLTLQWLGVQTVLQIFARFQTAALAFLILFYLFLLIFTLKFRAWRLSFLLVIFLLTASLTAAYFGTNWVQQIKIYRQQYIEDNQKKNENQKISNLDSAKTALARLLRRTKTATESVDTGRTQFKCDEQQSLQAAKACTYIIKTDGGHGSGFAVDSEYLLTNKHVIEQVREIDTIISGQQVPLQLWNYSQDADLALLKSPQTLTSCQLVDSTQIPLAETVYTVGWPNSAEGESSITKGIFSRFVTTQEGPIFIQTDAAINPGNSGGPLVSPCGVVGINTAKVAWSASDVPSEGFSFAITSNYALDKLEQLINTGKNFQLPVSDFGQTKYSFQQPSLTQEPANPQYSLTPEARQSWLQSDNITQELDSYWSENGVGVDQDRLTELKDLIARMQAVVDTVLPKIENNQALTQAEGSLLTEWNDMYRKAIRLEGELHNRDYSRGYAHYTCQNQSCLLVADRGRDDCQSHQDCVTSYHYQCQDMMCALVEGEGDNECNSHDDCYYYQCSDSGCDKVAGEGADECYYDWQCGN